MQFLAKDKQNAKRIKRKLLQALADDKVSKATIYKRYMRYTFFNVTGVRKYLSSVFPSASAVYGLIGAALISCTLVLYICNLNSNINKLSKEKEALTASAKTLSDNVAAMNSVLSQNKDMSRIHEATITEQQNSLSTIEETYQDELEEITTEKDAKYQGLLEYVNELVEIFGINSRSGNSDMSSVPDKISQAKNIITEALGDTPEASVLLTKLNSTEKEVVDNLNRYPDYEPTRGAFTSPYGYRRDPISGVTKFHSGIDVANSTGTSIYAAAAGTVIIAVNSDNGGYGKYIKIDHGNGYVTVYAHLSSLLVSVGDTVEKGQKIGLMGNTGYSTGSHLHFEVQYGGSTRNPLDYVFSYWK